MKLLDRTRRRGGVVGVAAIASVALLAAGCSSTASGPPTDPAQEIPVAFGLKRDQSGLEAAVADRSTPGSANYLKWLNQDSLRATYGASAESVASALQAAEAAGFNGAIDGSGSVLVGTMTPPEIKVLFGEDTVNVTQGSATVAQTANPVNIPNSMSDTVQDVAGLTFQVAEAEPSAPVASNNETCPPKSDLAARMNAFYGLVPLEGPGKGGAGVRIAMLEIDQYSPRALEIYSTCNQTQIAPVKNQKIDDSPESVFGQVAEESTLDIIAASQLAPQLAGIDTYQFNPFSPILFPLVAAIDDSYTADGPRMISSSVGFCEKTMTDSDIAISEWLLMSAAATGITTVAAAGDSGSSACAPSNTSEAAQYPASSPNAVGIGGTQFTANEFTAANQVVWNSMPESKLAGGGTAASRLPRPAYQSGLNTTGSGGSGRAVPDTSLIASPNEFGAIPVCDAAANCSMQVIGGTSASAPAFAAAMAVTLNAVDASGRGKNPARVDRLGQLNPTLYQLAGQASANPFTDVTQGNNDLYSVGCCAAGPGYDTASGWGSINFSKLAAAYRKLLQAPASN
ncbi:MAG: S8 family serine peptidase [Actinobacteria bacterium]|nr:S8 family serine peptidase [Actinomycetota bacterium]